ncbi:complex I NDUFA9 subunit family protein [Pukyongiella litopenaei]|uniref:Complex I NDUFA9 subunit family protein n=1 Tax=Pukyongiella litopenaei TaxID=2605946 RepID=A0A2S0MPK2_9RHOB|nr:complex I NDUFA9 subunit family protein [Pukyongiella litopenaei]AVO37794.1 complex I NDUFA9 subunit family protein [Pukyongiella litopenaei]
MPKLVTIYGGSGFIGRYIARRMARDGWRVRVAVRRPNEAIFVRPYGTVGQVEPVLCNIRDDASVAAAMEHADAVVNCVGILNETGKNTFEAIHIDGAARIARLAAQAGIGRLVHVSAIGADENGESAYLRSKGAGEQQVLAAFPDAVILRPSLVFGPEDMFFNRLGSMARTSPILPIIGAGTRFQPVFADDVSRAAAAALEGVAALGIYELGGPEIHSMRELAQMVVQEINRNRPVVNIPFWIARIMAFGLDMVQAVSFGLIANGVVTRDQLRGLGRDSVVADGARGFADLGITPVTAGSVLPEYLWRFRPSGQYDAIRESARNIRA